jgi:formylglycine-generating enzyme required for sulfatase activity
MKKLILIYFALIFSISFLQAGTIANVIDHKDLLLTIDRGSTDGVESGMKGIVKAVYKEPSGEYTINIGIFTVKKMFARSAEVIIEIGKGLNPDDARYVVFDQDLLPGESKPEPESGPKSEPKTESTASVKPVENVDWLLEQGDSEAEEGNTKAAMEHYQKALALAPGNLVAKEKYNEMQKEISTAERKGKFMEYLKKADSNYEKNNIKLAFLYLIEGLRIYSEGNAEVQDRLSIMAQEYPREIETILIDKAKELKDVRKQIDAMLGKTDEPKPKPAETQPAPTQANAQEAKSNEPFLQKIKGKADKIQQNEQGFWEAVFLKNITMIYIPEGEFTIGSPAREGDADEHPAHKVFVSGYWIGKTEVTFAQFDAFCQETGLEKPEDEGWGRGKRPVIYVSWKEANDFCAWLKKKTGFVFRLPTEAEWEKAARDRFPWGNTKPANHLANFNKEIMKTDIVGSYPEGASPYGVLDMAGNVWEWLVDWYAADYYENSADTDPQGPEEGEERVVRGGSWSNNAELIRSANRSQENPKSKLNIIGFRLALTGK